MSEALDANLAVLKRVRQDLLRRRKADAKKGREGMSAEQVLRAALIKQMFSFSYSELSFHLGDSNQLRGFCRLSPSATTPMKSALQSNIGSLRAETWETVNKAIVLHARARKVEDGRWMRTDTTVVESNIHPPLDSALLWDGVRVLTRIMLRAHDEYGTTRTNHRRRAKRRSIAILNAGRMDRRVPLYKDLLKVTHKTVRAAEKAEQELARKGAAVYATQLHHFLPLVKRVIRQTERRVLHGESVPAAEKSSASSSRIRTSFARTGATPTTVIRSRSRRAEAAWCSTSSSRKAIRPIRRWPFVPRNDTPYSSAQRPSVLPSTAALRRRPISKRSSPQERARLVSPSPPACLSTR